MRRPFVTPWKLLVCALVQVAGMTATGVAGAAPADFSGAYNGQLEVPRSRQVAAAASTLVQTGRLVSGTVTVTLSQPGLSGAYDVRGTVSGSRLQLAGRNAAGARLSWHAVLGTQTVTGAARLHGAGARIAGTLSLERSTPTNVSSCDDVLTQNLTFFTDQVMTQVLVPTCASCHTQGGLAQGSRLHVTPSDPLATARTTVALVDPANPTASRLLQKPLALVAHGGGQQLQAGSAAEQILQQWATVLAQSNCITPGGSTTGGTGADLYVANCAGCHGPDAAGTPGRPDVRCSARSWVGNAIRAGRGGGTAMPAFSAHDLAATDVDLIAQYLAGLCTGKPASVYASNCASCHGQNGSGGRNANGVRGSDIRCAGGGEFAGTVRSGSEGMPAFRDLSSARIQALATFLRSSCTGGGSGD